MKKAATFLSLVMFGLAAADTASAQAMGTIGDFVHRVMAPWAKNKTAILYADCYDDRTQAVYPGHLHSKHMIFFPLGATKGTYVVFGWSNDNPAWKKANTQATSFVTTLGSIAIKSHVEIDTPDQGGPWELAHEQFNGEYLLRRGLKILYPADFSAAVLAPSKVMCPDWDYNANNVEKFYKEQGWQY